MSAETWNKFFENVGIILLFLTFVCGLGFALTGRMVNGEQKAKLDQFDLDLTKAKTALSVQQERTALAENKLLELQKYQTPRQLTKEQFDAIQTLRGEYKAINVAFENDADSVMFSSELAVALKAAGIECVLYPRGDPTHSTGGIMLYDRLAFQNPSGKPTNGEPLLSTLKSVGLFSGSLQAGMPIDIAAPPEIPMIIVAGKAFPGGTPSPYLGSHDAKR
jgi:hypothetical protein